MARRKAKRITLAEGDRVCRVGATLAGTVVKVNQWSHQGPCAKVNGTVTVLWDNNYEGKVEDRWLRRCLPTE